MLYAILTLILLIAVYLPSMWVRIVMSRHGRAIDDMPGTGGELATHLIERFALDGIIVEATDKGNDHFDSSAPAVRLGQTNFEGKSLTAIAVAAHEVGHALQFAREEKIFQLRKRYLPSALGLKKIGIMLMAVAPVLAIVIKAPVAIFLVVAASLGLQLLGALMYLIILPEEWDASFNKALPMLIEGEYIQEHHIPAVRQVLKAAALTYFASALADLVNIGRWLMILRR